MKFGDQTNQNMLNSIFSFSVVKRKYPFQANLVQYVKNVCLRCNLAPTISDIISLQFSALQRKFDLPQVKLYLISGTVNSTYELSHQLLNNLRLRKLGNEKKMSKLGGDKGQCPVSLSSKN